MNDIVRKLTPKPFPRFPHATETGESPVASAETNGNRPDTYLISRNVNVNGHRTSVRLEPEMWNGMIDICRREGFSQHAFVERVAGKVLKGQSLTSAIRVSIMAYFKAATTEEGHVKAGHTSHWSRL